MRRRDFLTTTAGALAASVVPWPLAEAGGLRQARNAGAVRHVRQRALLRVDGARLNGWLSAFDAVGRSAGGINRVAYSPADLAGRAFTIARYREAGLDPRIDAIGNIVARIPGTDAAAAPIVIGSHVDSVTDGGNYDGPVGTFAAIEVARTLREGRVRLRHPLDVVTWQNEEGGTIGSKLAIGDFTDADLDKIARSGLSIRDGIGRIGGDVARLHEARRAKGSIACYLELHIEQGGRLEQATRQIGVVEGIVGLRWLEVTITGFANHAGATPMDQRQDALLAASRFAVAVHEAVRRVPGRQVATVGRVVAVPNTTNVIAGQVTLTVDLRDLDQSVIDRFTREFEALGRTIGAETSTTFRFATTVDAAPALASPGIMQHIDRAAEALGLSRMVMPSGAGHDAQEMARIGPMGMIFIPSVGGVSHSPREFSRPDDITAGANVLLHAVLAADRAR